MTHRYVDDMTITELLDKPLISYVQSYIDELSQQTTRINITANDKKTIEMLIGTALKLRLT